MTACNQMDMDPAERGGDRTAVVTIHPDGRVEVIDGHEGAEVAAQMPELAGRMTKRRASHVEPEGLLWWLAFHLVRRLVADDSPAAEWTRGWPCLWRVNIIGGPVLPERFGNRAAAIAAEVEWLHDNGVPE